jgi:lysophospholipase L1-like esterase
MRKIKMMLFCLLILITTVKATPPVTVVTTGDSITNGYTWRLDNSLNDMLWSNTIVNVAEGGLQSIHYVGELPLLPGYPLRDFTTEVLAADPDVICFMLGTNDSYGDSGAVSQFEGYKTRLISVFDQFETSGKKVIISTLIPMLRIDPSASEANWRINEWYNPWLISTSNEYGFYLLDMNTIIQEQDNWESLYREGDWVHLSTEGQIWMADQFAIAIVDVMLLEGDANRDGVVSAGDYTAVQAKFGNFGEPGLLGDANRDGIVSAGDYASIQANFGNTEAIPEPMTLLLLSAGFITVLVRKK